MTSLEPETIVARNIAWTLGIVSPWYLRPSQLEVYQFIEKTDSPFVECSRRWGKTTDILVYVMEKLRANPGWVCRWCEPQKNQARVIVEPEIEKIQEHCPDELKFKYQTTDSVYIHPNGSKIYLVGVNEDKGMTARGSFAHIVVADEFGFWTCPDIIESILQPQLLTTRGQMIIASTPPEELGHPYYSKKKVAIRDGRYISKTIYDNESLTQADIDKAAADCGGYDSPTFRREYLCEEVPDVKRQVVPEFKEDVHVVDDDYPRPSHFDAYVGMDLGFADFTAAPFGYWDFEKRELVIEDELWMNASSSQQITERAKSIERALWGNVKPYLRVADNDKQQLYDMLTMCDYSVIPTRKDDLEAAINGLRLRFTRGQIKIKKRCKNLIYQLKVGMWNQRKTDFERAKDKNNETLGHLDLIMALVYLNRNINEHHNPFPPQWAGLDPSHNWINPVSSSQDEEALKQAFNSFSRSRG